MNTPARRYGGATLAERRAERREKLIRAAVQVASRNGRDGASVTAICAEAGLTARYFYEHFPNRDALFLAAFDAVQDALFGMVEPQAAGRDPVKGALTGFFRALAEHPGPARVFLVELDEADPAMKEMGRAASARFGSLFAPGVAADSLVQAGASGAVIQIARRWVRGGFAEPVEQVVAVALPFAKAAAKAAG